MSYTYKPFPLDAWVSRYYKTIGVLEPADINLKFLSRSMRIFLSYSPKRSFSRVDGNFKMINIYENADIFTQREIFFHELCHILRHEGYQFQSMPAAFRELQEREANHFIRYAAIPLHMLYRLDWKSESLVYDMVETFKVSEEICVYRVEQIKRNWLLT